jgi:aryl-alcohol dehydrogenase-like predicted oxidoreductase
LDEKDARTQRFPRFTPEAIDQNNQLVARIRKIAQARTVTPGQLALAWVLSKGEDLVPIPGTKRRKYLEENAEAVDIKLTPGEMEQLEAAVPLHEIAGDRYAPQAMKAIDRSA